MFEIPELFFKQKSVFGTAGQKWSNNVKNIFLFWVIFSKKHFVAVKKEATLSPAEKRAIRQGFEMENNITRLSREISIFLIHSFILTFRPGAAYQP